MRQASRDLVVVSVDVYSVRVNSSKVKRTIDIVHDLGKFFIARDSVFCLDRLMILNCGLLSPEAAAIAA